MRRLALAGTLVFTSSLAQGCIVTLDSQSEIVREERRFAIKDTPTVQVSTYDGAIDIQSWDKPEVMVEIEKRGPTRESVNELQIKSSQDGDTITLDIPKPATSFHPSGMRQSPTARLIVWLPGKSNVTARRRDGSIMLHHVT